MGVLRICLTWIRRRSKSRGTSVAQLWRQLFRLTVVFMIVVVVVLLTIGMPDDDLLMRHRKHMTAFIGKHRILKVRNLNSSILAKYQTRQTLTNVPGYRIYPFSAIFGSRIHGNRTLHITAWIDKQLLVHTFKCCIQMQTRRIIETPATFPSNTFNMSEHLFTTVFQCQLDVTFSAMSAVSLTLSTTTCHPAPVPTLTASPSSISSYIRPILPIPVANTNTTDAVAICSKIAYGHLDPLALVEWLEVQRYLGVSKILVHAYVSVLNVEAMVVFEHYQNTGLVELIPFVAAETFNNDYPRSKVNVTGQGLADERLSIYDCLLRSSEFAYFSTLDKDEVILPAGDLAPGALNRYLAREFTRNRRMASLVFPTQLHLTAGWGETRTRHPMQYLNRYQACSRPIPDRSKFVADPRRITYWNVETHRHSAAAKYISLMADSSIATLHHYRRPREARDPYTIRHEGHRVVKSATLPPGGQCVDMAAIADIVQPAVVRVLDQLDMH